MSMSKTIEKLSGLEVMVLKSGEKAFRLPFNPTGKITVDGLAPYNRQNGFLEFGGTFSKIKCYVQLVFDPTAYEELKEVKVVIDGDIANIEIG